MTSRGSEPIGITLASAAEYLASRLLNNPNPVELESASDMLLEFASRSSSGKTPEVEVRIRPNPDDLAAFRLLLAQIGFAIDNYLLTQAEPGPLKQSESRPEGRPS